MQRWEVTIDKTVKTLSQRKYRRYIGLPVVVTVPALTEKQARITVRGLGHRGDILRVRRVV